jgi:hypothetical protein
MKKNEIQNFNTEETFFNKWLFSKNYFKDDASFTHHFNEIST